MNYSDDAFATMLLTMALSPNREEYALPYSALELNKLEKRLQENGIYHIGQIINYDIGKLSIKIDSLSEEEAYRIFTLLNRSMQISYSIDNYLQQGIEIVTCHNEEYPERIRRKMQDYAPPMFYRCGNPELLTSKPMLAIIGISGVKTPPEVRDGIETIVRNCVRMGYTILTGGELGVSKVAMNMVAEYGGDLVEIVGGDMNAHMVEDGIADLLKENRATIVSLEHPDALFTVPHAISRNKLLFSLAEAAIVINTDGKRGETDAIKNRYCDWIYAWKGYQNNLPLISRGAIAVGNLSEIDLDTLCRRWKSSRSEQLNFLDMLTD